MVTSLAHPWGSAATYLLTEYVLGVQGMAAGSQTWSFRPRINGFGLESAQGTIPTPYGEIAADWQVDGGNVTLTVEGPMTTSGVVQGTWLAGIWSINGAGMTVNGSVAIEGV